jgi:YidC/Oxa1 family membrane protein insertase
MGRQILPLVLVFVGVMLLMRMCAAPPPPQKGLPVEVVEAPPSDATPLKGPNGEEVLLAGDGSVLSITGADGAVIVRPTPPNRHPFHLFLGQTDQAARVPEGGWTREEVPGGFRYVYAKDKLRIEKTLHLSADGRALILDLKAEGIEQKGLLLTGASGLNLTSEEGKSPFLFTQIADSKPRIQPYAGLKQAREGAAQRRYAVSEELTAADTERVKRFGIFGTDACLDLEDLPAVSKLFADAYRARREGGSETDEAETWLELAAGEGSYSGTFTLRWTPAAEAASLFPSTQTRPGTEYVLENDTFRVVFTDRGAAIREMWLKRFSVVAGEPPSPATWIPILNAGAPEGERSLTLLADGHGTDPAHEVWEAKPAADGKSILFTLSTPDGWRFEKLVSLPERDRYDLGVEITAVAPAGTTGGQTTVSLIGPTGPYIVDSYRGIIGAEAPATFILDRNGDDDSETIESLKKKLLDRSYPEEKRGLFRAIGTRGTYFVVALVSEDPKNAVTNATGKEIELERVGILLRIEGGRATQSFRLYAGPNETSALKDLKIEGSIHFGWFGTIGRFLMWILKGLHAVLGSWGIAIMFLTAIVRGCLLPVSFKTQLSMQRYGKRMQKIKPILDEVQKKYAKDPTRLNQERMKVMREHGVGLPLGCLMMFFQIPIWFALFQALRVEFALRHQSFLWVKDISMPDRLIALPFWPNWLNILPILMLVLWVVQQKFAPTPGSSDDPQVKMQMKMMRFMPFVFFFMLYNYAAALALYMCVSSCWTIAESRLVRRAIAKLG